jgi:hypothetical protein
MTHPSTIPPFDPSDLRGPDAIRNIHFNISVRPNSLDDQFILSCRMRSRSSAMPVVVRGTIGLTGRRIPIGTRNLMAFQEQAVVSESSVVILQADLNDERESDDG